MHEEGHHSCQGSPHARYVVKYITAPLIFELLQAKENVFFISLAISHFTGQNIFIHTYINYLDKEQRKVLSNVE